jgi:hypothetical protein
VVVIDYGRLCVVTQGGGSNEVCISLVLCGVELGFPVPVRSLTQDNKEEKSWWT